ncbi:MAG: hypothetical protein JXA08_05830 [Methanomicrobiaceae archaeon]|nr:hypothetical protein [Methanomicrobiaceae archaeon]
MKRHLFACIAVITIWIIAATPASAIQPLVVDLTHTPDPVRLGETVSYTITYMNPNPETVHNIEIDADISACGVQHHWSPGPLAGGATGSVGWTDQVSEWIYTGLHIDYVTVRSDETGTATISGLTYVIFADPILVAITDTPDPVCPGESTTFSIEYANPNPFALTSVCLTGFLSVHLNFISSTCNGFFCAATNTVEWFLGTICGGATGTVSFCGTVDPSVSPDGVIPTQLTVRSDEAGLQGDVTETTTVKDTMPVPEFPSSALPAAMIAGSFALCAGARRRV